MRQSLFRRPEMGLSRRIALVLSLIVLGCAGLLALDTSFRMNTDAAPPHRARIVDAAPRQVGGELSPQGEWPDDWEPGTKRDGVRRPHPDDPPPLSDAEVRKWRDGFLAEVGRAEAACGQLVQMVCDNQVCVAMHPLRLGPAEQIQSLFRQPRRLIEPFLPPSMQPCLVQAGRLNRHMGEPRTFGEHLCYAYHPPLEGGNIVARKHAEALCETLAR